MSQASFDRILASLHEAAIDDTYWPATSLLIDEACGAKGNALLVGQGPGDDVRVRSEGLYWRGERQEDIEREYLEIYHPLDERVGAPQTAAGQPCGSRQRALQRRGIEDLSDIQRTDAAFDRPEQPERASDPVAGHSSDLRHRRARPRGRARERPTSPGAAPVAPCAPVRTCASGAGRRRGLGHLAHRPGWKTFRSVSSTWTGSAGSSRRTTPRCGILRLGNGLRDANGILSAWHPADATRLERLIARALPIWSDQVGGGSMLVRRPVGLPQ